MDHIRAFLSTVPWKNSWLQMSLVAALLSGGLLAMDLTKGMGASSSSPAPAPSPGPAPTPPPAPANLPSQDAHAFTNSLGMKFVPAGTSGVLFSIWDTRVEDFQQFVNATNYNAIGSMNSLGTKGWVQEGKTWSDPGFNQGPDSPVVGVSWNDANAFCSWLTTKDQQAGVISGKQVYRLPTDAEWSAAVGTALYPWGNDMPPPANAGNIGRLGDGWTDSQIAGSDGYINTSPVGAFAPNGYGLFDMGGNAFQWVQDVYYKEMNPPDILRAFPEMENFSPATNDVRTARGSGWDRVSPFAVRSQFHVAFGPGERWSHLTFRCVLTRPFSFGSIYLWVGLAVVVLAAAWHFLGGKRTREPAAS